MSLVCPPKPYRFLLEDLVYIKRYCQEMLEHRQKGHFIILLVTPTAIKVDGVAFWIHYTHARPADPFALKED